MHIAESHLGQYFLLKSIYMLIFIQNNLLFQKTRPMYVCWNHVKQGFSKFTFKGPNLNYHQCQRSEIIVITKLVFINMLITIQLNKCLIIIFMTSSGRTCVYEN